MLRPSECSEFAADLVVGAKGRQSGKESEAHIMSYVKGLKCKEADCGRTYPTEPHHICEYCFGKLEVDYDYEAIGSAVSRGS